MGFVEMQFPNGHMVRFGDETAQSSIQFCDGCDYYKPLDGGKTIEIMGDDSGQTGEVVAWLCRDCANGR